MQENEDNKKPQGEKVEEINSEITEIIGLQKQIATAESEFAACGIWEAIMAKIDTHIRSRAKRNPKYKDDIKLLEDINFLHRNDYLENIKSVPRVKDWLPTVFLHIGNDLTTKNIVPSEYSSDTRRDMKEDAYARLKEKRRIQCRKMMAIIADEFDLNRNLADRGMTANSLKGRYK